jgi:hypothetical protein
MVRGLASRVILVHPQSNLCSSCFASGLVNVLETTVGWGAANRRLKN